MKRVRLHAEQPGNLESGRILARTGMKALARRLGFGEQRIQIMETVLAEMLSNQVKYAAGTGQIQIWEHQDEAGGHIDFFALDFGPGIPDLGRARRDGASSGGTLGKGIGAMERMADCCSIYSLTGGQGRWSGVAVWVRFHRRESIGERCRHGAYLRALNDDRHCGDGLWLRDLPDGVAWLHLDGLGHGREAAEAVHGRERLLARLEGQDCESVLSELDGELRRSRGAVGLLGCLDRRNSRIQLCGVGDMQAWQLGAGERRSIHFSPGVLGREHRRVMAQELVLAPGDLFISGSDGIRSRWHPHDYPGLWQCHPQLVAYFLGALEGRSNDDRSLLVIAAG